MKKTLVLYVFHALNDRVYHFFNNAIFQDDNVDFLVISNNKQNKFELPNYVNVLYRDNIGFDFAGWSEGLLTDDLYKHYENFIFVNSSVIGPFMPTWCKEKWTDVFINGLTDNVKLFGSTINTMQYPWNSSHVQTYIFSMNRETLEYLIECKIFCLNEYTNSIYETVNKKERLMSTKIIQKGWNIGSLFNHYKGVDFTFTTKKVEDYNIEYYDDIMFNEYNNKLWNKYDLVFIKGNRITL